MSLQNLGFYIDKLYLINKELGGKSKEEQGAKEADEFDNIKALILESIHKTRKKMDEKMEKFEGFGKSAETLKIDIEIKDLFSDIEKMLGSMNEILRRQAKNSKKYSKTEIENKEKMYGNLRNQIKDLKELDKESANVSMNSGNKGETLTDLKSRLMERPKNTDVRRELNEEEKQAIGQFKETDKKIDEFVDKINEGVLIWKDKAKKMGEQIDETTIRIGNVEAEVDKATTELMTTNKKLKAIVDKYRQPNKFCLDIVLVALLIGLIGVMIKLLASK